MLMILFVASLFKLSNSLQGKLLNNKWPRNLSRLSSSVDKSNNFYITTPIYYVNGQPHLGHAYTSIASDVIARYQRCKGKNVFFLTGTDEHGQKVEQSASNAGETPIQFADTVSNSFRKLTQELHCSNDDFIRTTQERHKIAVKALWKKLIENNKIYLGAYEGWYSVRDEAFYAESELVDGKAPTGAPVEWVKESSYFFKLSEYTDKLLQLYDENPDFIGPRGRRNEVISFVSQEGGLRDLSISRTTFKWGIEVPNDPEHVVYVWLDALTNYITAIGYPDITSTDSTFYKYWPADLHIVGKDILRFHAIFWPAFLMAADLPVPKKIFAHGWWTRDGEKMSKSLGNVIDPFILLQLYHVDYIRYFLISEITFGGDGDFTHESFAIRINTDLANDVGNLLQRVTTFIQKNFNNQIPQPIEFNEDDKKFLDYTTDCINQAYIYIENQNLKSMCENIINIAKEGNRYIDINAPWKSIKIDTVRCGTVLYVLAESLRRCAILLQPIMPTSATMILDQLGVSAEQRTFASLDSINLTPLSSITAPTPVFPKIDLSKLPQELLKPTPPPVTINTTTSTSTTTTAAAAAFPDTTTMSLDELNSKVSEIGDTIRQMKTEKKSKEELKPYIDYLLVLKERY